LAAALGCGLWLGKNWVLTGNPTYPLLGSVFHGKTRTTDKDRQWNLAHGPKDFSIRAVGADAARVGLRSDWLSPLLMPLAAIGGAAGLRRRKQPHPAQVPGLNETSVNRTAMCLLLYFGYVLAAWWLQTHRIDRFWIPAISVAALLAGQGVHWSQGPLWRRSVLALLALSVVWSFLVVASGATGDNRYFQSLVSLRDDPKRVDPWHRYFNAHVNEGRVLLVGDAQAFDLEVPVLYNTCFDDCIFAQLAAGRSPQEIRREMKERDIAYVYVDWGEMARYRGPRNYGYNDRGLVQPELFDRLAAQGVWEPLPPIQGHAGRAYRVK